MKRGEKVPSLHFKRIKTDTRRINMNPEEYVFRSLSLSLSSERSAASVLLSKSFLWWLLFVGFGVFVGVSRCCSSSSRAIFSLRKNWCLSSPPETRNECTDKSLSLSLSIHEQQQLQRLLVQALGASKAFLKLFCFFSSSSSSSSLTSFKERRVFL